MQAIDVFGCDGDSVLSPRVPISLQSGERHVSRVGLNIACCKLAPPGVLEILHPGQVLREGFRCGHILNVRLRSDPTRIRKCVQAGPIGDAGACQNDDVLVTGNCHDKRG